MEILSELLDQSIYLISVVGTGKNTGSDMIIPHYISKCLAHRWFTFYFVSAGQKEEMTDTALTPIFLRSRPRSSVSQGGVPQLSIGITDNYLPSY